jgi:hypothetical protein
MQRTYTRKILDVVTTGNSGYIDTHYLKEMQLLVVSVGDAVDSQATTTFYGSADATNKYKLGITQALDSSTLDADGVIVYDNTALQTILYNVSGVHPYIYIDEVATTAIIGIKVYLIGQEEV